MDEVDGHGRRLLEAARRHRRRRRPRVRDPRHRRQLVRRRGARGRRAARRLAARLVRPRLDRAHVPRRSPAAGKAPQGAAGPDERSTARRSPATTRWRDLPSSVWPPPVEAGELRTQSEAAAVSVPDVPAGAAARRRQARRRRAPARRSRSSTRPPARRSAARPTAPRPTSTPRSRAARRAFDETDWSHRPRVPGALPAPAARGAGATTATAMRALTTAEAGAPAFLTAGPQYDVPVESLAVDGRPRRVATPGRPTSASRGRWASRPGGRSGARRSASSPRSRRGTSRTRSTSPRSARRWRPATPSCSSRRRTRRGWRASSAGWPPSAPTCRPACSTS